MSGEVHVHPSHAEDPTGYPPCRVAHSRKVMKGEDKSFAAPGAEWRGVRFDAFGLFDGHGGKAAAEHCAEAFVPALLNALDAPGPTPEDADPEDVFEDRIADALARAFDDVDAQFLARDVHSGATATMCVVNGRHVHSAAVGDSLATLDCGHGCAPVRLTPEHRLDTSASERRRVEERGGEVRATAFEDGKPVGPLRVWPGGLAVSRSIGDRDGKKGGVSSVPEVSQVLIPDSQPGYRLVLASDGLWDAVTVKQAAQCGAKLGTGPCAAALCKLAQKQKDNRDDITVLVVDYLADARDKSPLTNKPPWRTELEVRWPLGRRRYDPVQPASARRKARVDGDAEAERVEREAIDAARARAAADATAAANARRLAELEAYERSKASALDGDDGWEEVGKGHGRGVESSPPRESPPVPRAKKEKKTDAGGKKPGGGRGGRGADGVKSGRGGGRAGRGGRGVGRTRTSPPPWTVSTSRNPRVQTAAPRPRPLPPPIDGAAAGLEVPTPNARATLPSTTLAPRSRRRAARGRRSARRSAPRGTRAAAAANRLQPHQPHHPQHPQPHTAAASPAAASASSPSSAFAATGGPPRAARAATPRVGGDARSAPESARRVPSRRPVAAATGHRRRRRPPAPTRFTPPAHIAAHHAAGASASPVHQGPAPPASPGVGDPPEAGGDGSSVAKKPKPKRKGRGSARWSARGWRRRPAPPARTAGCRRPRRRRIS